ncbi:skin secretory protein xP2-like isoform X2 [Trichoplusia ni]|uniref:Skin secretory protein xP2-like isoform X2 n=1 Tax=Trichoplusia ni TaxID=7111 RepID=A0A7E5W5J3_TRINI|nr:skin secretory protein xP2-like isoform X2 [Trichoplusia ni]
MKVLVAVALFAFVALQVCGNNIPTTEKTGDEVCPANIMLEDPLKATENKNCNLSHGAPTPDEEKKEEPVPAPSPSPAPSEATSEAAAPVEVKSEAPSSEAPPAAAPAAAPAAPAAAETPAPAEEKKA